MVPFLRIRIRPELKSSKLSGIVLTLNHKMKIKLLAFSSIDGCDGIINYLDQTVFASVPDFLFTESVLFRMKRFQFSKTDKNYILSGSLMLLYDCN